MAKNAAGVWEADLRFKGLPRLHLSLRTPKKAMARERYQALRRVLRERRLDLIDDLRTRRDSVERIAALVAAGQPLDRLPSAPRDAAVAGSHWGTVDAVVTRYLAWMASAQRAPRTVELAGYQCQRFQEFLYQGRRTGDYALEDVTRAHILAYQQRMIDAGTPANTLATYMARVQGIWTFAGKDERDAAAEEKRATVPLYVPIKAETIRRETTARERVLSVAEGQRLLAASPDRFRFFVGGGLLGGLRQGETLHLRPMLDVDLTVGTMTVQKQTDWRPKTQRSCRIVPMSPALKAMAEQHAARYASSAWMFPSPMIEGAPVTPDFVNKEFAKIVERAGMRYGRGHRDGVTYHTLRHSFASHAVSNGVDLYTVAKLLGDSLATVERTYAHLSPDTKLAAVRQVAAAFNLAENDTANATV